MSPVEVWDANDEVVALSFFRRLRGSNEGTALSLPEDTTKWPDGLFVRLSVVGGNADHNLNQTLTAIQVDVYGTSGPGSGKAPWPACSRVAHDIINRCRGRIDSRTYPTQAGYGLARVIEASPQTTPRRIPDSAGYARYTFDVLLTWSRVS